MVTGNGRWWMERSKDSGDGRGKRCEVDVESGKALNELASARREKPLRQGQVRL